MNWIRLYRLVSRRSLPYHTTNRSLTTAAGRRARLALSSLLLQEHGFRLANVNPLRSTDGFMVPSSLTTTKACDTVRSALPTMLQPLVDLVQQSRGPMPTEIISLPSILQQDKKEAAALLQLLQTYCNTGIAWEYMHVATQAERDFFARAATMRPPTWAADDIFYCFQIVATTAAWEDLLQHSYPQCRRFSLQGLETAVLCLQTVINTVVADTGSDGMPSFDRVVMGCLHRGRMTFLATLLQLPIPDLLRQWDVHDGPTYEDICLGRSSDAVQTRHGPTVHLALLPTPAHLEAQNATVSGKAYGHVWSRAARDNVAPQSLEWKAYTRTVLPLLVHGDASVCGQGMVTEALQLSTFREFDCGGTIHLILNNQVGFTGETQVLRSTPLVGVSDVAHSIRAPVLHVNADKPMDVYYAAQVAAQYRQTFGKDVFIELWGYRRHGHNEVDEPRMTNVNLYQNVDLHAPVVDLFLREVGEKSLADKLMAEKEKSVAKMKNISRLSTAKESQEDAKTTHSSAGAWRDFRAHHLSKSMSQSGVTLSQLKEALEILVSIPDGFSIHPLVRRTISRRADLLSKSNEGKDLWASPPRIDWATAELLALSTLALNGGLVRLCGQDSQRGTFGQRQAVWHNIETGEVHHPMPKGMQVVDSPLSELGVVGFEHGISLANPNIMTLWEAQFGDFSNNAQTLFDTMICSEKEKFGLDSNLVLLLPHGYDGMGPEHSSCRLERFLTLHTDTPEKAATEKGIDRHKYTNFVVAYPSTPASYFHLLRRSFFWPFRRPLIVATPKRTLRLPQASSPLEEFLVGQNEERKFRPVLDDPRHLDSDKVQSIALCSGEIFYDLLNEFKSVPLEVSNSVAIIRLEELAPFPSEQLREIVKRYSFAQRMIHVQEEPFNMGSWRFVAPFLSALSCMPNQEPPIARPTAAAPAVGDPEDHKKSQSDLLERFRNWVRQV